MKDMIGDTYQRFQIEQLAQQLERTQLEGLVDEESQAEMDTAAESEIEESKDSMPRSQKREKRKNKNEDALSEIDKVKEQLKSDKNLMIAKDRVTVVKKPAPNKKCPCNSKKAYKKCCMSSDQERTNEFIEGANKMV